MRDCLLGPAAAGREGDFEVLFRSVVAKYLAAACFVPLTARRCLEVVRKSLQRMPFAASSYDSSDSQALRFELSSCRVATTVHRRYPTHLVHIAFVRFRISNRTGCFVAQSIHRVAVCPGRELIDVEPGNQIMVLKSMQKQRDHVFILSAAVRVVCARRM